MCRRRRRLLRRVFCRGITRSRRRWLVLGAGMAATGAGMAATGAWRISATLILTGWSSLSWGLVLCTPAIVGLVARTPSSRGRRPGYRPR